MARVSLLTALLLLLLALCSLRADDGKPALAKKPKSPAEVKAKLTGSAPPAVSRDRLKQVLRDALKQIQAMDEDAAKSQGKLDPLTQIRMTLSMPKGVQAQTIAAIGKSATRGRRFSRSRARRRPPVRYRGHVHQSEGRASRTHRQTAG
jgi:hypothetical protein